VYTRAQRIARGCEFPKCGARNGTRQSAQDRRPVKVIPLSKADCSSFIPQRFIRSTEPRAIAAPANCGCHQSANGDHDSLFTALAINSDLTHADEAAARCRGATRSLIAAAGELSRNLNPFANTIKGHPIRHVDPLPTNVRFLNLSTPSRSAGFSGERQSRKLISEIKFPKSRRIEGFWA
jgi:hypothetical protein